MRLWSSSKMFRGLVSLIALQIIHGVTLNAQTVDSHYSPSNGVFYSLALHSDGRVLAGYAGGYDHQVVQLYGDGTLDPSLQMPNSMMWEILALAVQDDGKILVGGDGGPLVRLNAN